MALRCVVMIEKWRAPSMVKKADQPAALVDHRQADLAAERLGLGDAGLEHLEAGLVGEPMSGNDVGHGGVPGAITGLHLSRP